MKSHEQLLAEAQAALRYSLGSACTDEELAQIVQWPNGACTYPDPNGLNLLFLSGGGAIKGACQWEFNDKNAARSTTRIR